MADALRKFRDKVVAEGEAITRRIDESEGMKRLRRATKAGRIAKPGRGGLPQLPDLLHERGGSDPEVLGDLLIRS